MDTQKRPNKSEIKTSFTLFFVKFCNCGHYQDSSASFLDEERGGRGEGREGIPKCLLLLLPLPTACTILSSSFCLSLGPKNGSVSKICARTFLHSMFWLRRTTNCWLGLDSKVSAPYSTHVPLWLQNLFFLVCLFFGHFVR